MLGDGMGVKLEGINTQLDRAVKSLTTIKSLTGDVSKSLNNTNIGGGGGGTTGNGSSGNSMMPGGGGNFSNGAGSGGSGMSALSTGAMGVVKGLATVAGAAIGAINNGLPDVTQTIGRANQYYGASLTGGPGVTRNSIAAATFNGMAGGMTSVGSDAMVAGRLTAAGVAFGTAQYSSTVAGVSNAAKYLGMDNSTAVNAITGLKTGSMSATLQRNFGIQTSDFKTGNPLTQGAIFDQLAGKIFTPGKKLTAENIMSSYQQGWAGADLAKSGLSQDQQQLFVQYMIEKSKGNNMNLEDPAAMKKLIAAQQANGNLNPGAAGMAINTTDTSLMQTVTDSYIKGQQDAVPIIKAANDALGNLPPAIFEAKAALDTLAGARSTGAAMTAVGAAAGGLVTAFVGAAGVLALMMKGAGGAGGGGGLVGRGGPGAGIPSALGKAAKGVGVIGAVVNTAANGINAYNTTQSGGDPWANIWGDMGTAAASGALIGGIAGAPAGGVGAIPGALIGAVGGAVTTLLGTWLGSGAANATKPQTAGGSATGTPGMGTTTANAPANTSLTFILPAPGKIGSRFGDTEGRSVPHNGLDILCPAGTPVSASGDGVVLYMKYDNIGGNTIIIKHSDKLFTWYCHLSAYGSAIGKSVKQGERIGTSGYSGTVVPAGAGGAHLHFGASTTEFGNNWINPESILNGAISAAATTGAAATAGNGATSNSTTSAGNVGNIGVGGSLVSDSMISDMRAKNAAPHLAGLGASNSSSSATVGQATASKGSSSALLGTGAQASGGDSAFGQAGSQSIYLAGAPRAKNGQAYVANDGPINVHQGEAVLTSEEAATWRADKLGQGGKGRGTNVTINVTVASASEAEARKFAKVVKSYLEEDTMFGRMGRN